MTVRGIAAMAFASLGLIAICQPANSAVVVYGRGPSQACYEAAEFGTDAMSGIPFCDQALAESDITPRDTAATLINRSILRTHAGDYQNAIVDCNHGLSIDSDMAEGYVDRGVAEIMMKDWPTALADINKGIDMNTDKLDFAYYDRGIVEESTGNIRAAYEDYKKAVQMNPDFELAAHALTHFKVVRRPADSSSNGT